MKLTDEELDKVAGGGVRAPLLPDCRGEAKFLPDVACPGCGRTGVVYQITESGAVWCIACGKTYN